MILGRNIPEVWLNSLAESTVVMALVCPYEQPAPKGRQVALSAGDNLDELWDLAGAVVLKA